MKKRALLCIAFASVICTLHATHNRAGEIAYRQLDARTIECSIITYTETTSPADRDSVRICWGDGMCQWLWRVNGPDDDNNQIPDGEWLNNGYRRNVYQGRHSYENGGEYLLAMTDPNRNPGILNINGGATTEIPFHIQTQFTLDSEINDGPVLLEAPIDVAYVGRPFIHIPNAYDPQGDSLAYRMITPLMAEGEAVPNYAAVTDIGPGPDNQLAFDEATGLLIWEAPQLIGEYNIAIEVLSYRDGELNGRLIRDMQVLVLADEDMMPQLTTNAPSESAIIDVEVDDVIQFDIFSQDDDAGQSIEMTSSSGLYNYFDESASFEVITRNDGNPGEARFRWTVLEEQVRDQPYQVVFKSRDDLGLANYVLVRFRVSDIISQTIDAEHPQDVEIYPNPSADRIYIKATDIHRRPFVIRHLSGVPILSGRSVDPDGIFVGFLPVGVYILEMGDGGFGLFVKT